MGLYWDYIGIRYGPYSPIQPASLREAAALSLGDPCSALPPALPLRILERILQKSSILFEDTVVTNIE